MKKSNLMLVFTQILIISTILLVRFSNKPIFLPFRNKFPLNSTISIKEKPVVIRDNNGFAICTEDSIQETPQICSDGEGGAIITWVDWRYISPDIYAQRVDSSGGVVWEVNGTAICTEGVTQETPQICSDGEGGAIITWRDWRNGNTDIYAQRINSSGGVEWDVDGMAICTASNNQDTPQICSDGEVGAIITWTDWRNRNEDIYAQRINSSGDIKWDVDGMAICTTNDSQQTPQICSDGELGAIITWSHCIGGPNFDIYAQKIDSNGDVKWMDNGTAICMANNTQQKPQICSDKAGGAIITWEDGRIVPSTHIYAQRINSSGDTKWITDGVKICNASPWSKRDPQICSDEAGGAIITWQDWRDAGINLDIYVQKVNFSGNVEWTDDGVAICMENDLQQNPQICSDGAGGAIITWEDYRTGSNWDIYAQKINSSGKVEFTLDGVIICSVNTDQNIPQICSDSNGGAIITWQDKRDGILNDIYAQLIVNDSNPTSNHPIDIQTTPSGLEAIHWRLYDDHGAGKYRVWVNDNNNNYYEWIKWTSWDNNTYVLVPINRTALGTFNYTIEYCDYYNQTGISDTVIVKVTKIPKELPSIPIGIEGRDIFDILSSPPGLGIAIGIIAAFSIIITILIKNNKTIKQKDKTIQELQHKISKTQPSKKS
ncbi:MAG: hypothetical protein HWN67_03490 [Candidatus Helarchaeota archaeon]|nr:hypothetical protein [Candidatus Helarchaeota archaeon]